MQSLKTYGKILIAMKNGLSEINCFNHMTSFLVCTANRQIDESGISKLYKTKRIRYATVRFFENGVLV